MALYNQFISKQNKGLLWNLLYKNGAFNDVSKNDNDRVIQEFDYKIFNIGNTITESDQLVNLNKRAITEFMQTIEIIKKGKKIENVSSTVASSSVASSTVADATMVYNSTDLLQQRQKVFDNELKQKQDEFENFNAKPVPDKIDFADKLDTPMGAEMDRILAEQIALRERQLILVGPPPPPPTETKGVIATPPAKQALQPPTKNIGVLTIPTAQALIQKEGVTTILKIGEEINNDIVINSLSPIRKKVNFIEPYEPDNKEDFMHLFKKTPSNEVSNEVKDILLEILNNQRQILLRLDAMAP